MQDVSTDVTTRELSIKDSVQGTFLEIDMNGRKRLEVNLEVLRIFMSDKQTVMDNDLLFSCLTALRINSLPVTLQVRSKSFLT